MEISTATSIVIPRPRGEVFDFCTMDDTFERLLRPLGPIAGVAKSEMGEGQALQTGADRRITLTDGAVLNEEILDYTPPLRHQYRWVGGIKPPFSWLVRSGTGLWQFSEVEGGTRVDWSYVFEVKSAVAYVLVQPIAPLFRRWMAQGLNAVAAELIARGDTPTTEAGADQPSAQRR
jgi:hypothetical protein